MITSLMNYWGLYPQNIYSFFSLNFILMLDYLKMIFKEVKTYLYHFLSNG